MSNPTYHFPPELLELLIDTIPLLCRTKRSVLRFFQGAGVERSLIRNFETKLAENAESVNKYEIARTILLHLNEMHDHAIRERREVLKRVTEFEDYSTCWPDDQLKAKGLVAEIRRVVYVKDSFTRMHQERNAEVFRRQEEQRIKAEALRKQQETAMGIKSDLYTLFSMENTQKRGKLFEDVLNRLFSATGILIREDFRRISELGKGVVEQIDGVIELDGSIYLVEAKWLKEPVDVPDISQHLSRLFLRGDSRGIVISYSGFTGPAIAICKEALTKKTIVLCTLEEIVYLLEREDSLKALLQEKIRHSVVEKDPFYRVL